MLGEQSLPDDGWLILGRSPHSFLNVFLVFWTSSCVASHLRKADLNIEWTCVSYTPHRLWKSHVIIIIIAIMMITKTGYISISGPTCVPHPLQDATDDWMRASSLAAFVHWPSPVRHTAQTGFCGRKHACKQPWQNLRRDIEKNRMMTRKQNHLPPNYLIKRGHYCISSWKGNATSRCW